MKLIFLVIASEDSVHELDLVTQQQTWAASLPQGAKVLWLRGQEGKNFDFDGKTLYVPCLELYGNILEKTILGVKYLFENVDFDILVRTNVSTYFNVEKTLLELKKKRYKGDFFGGYIDKSNGGYFGVKGSQDYISGTGIFLSRSVAGKLASLDFLPYKAVPDDLAISHFLELLGIRKVRMSRNNLGSTHIFIPSYFIRAKSSAVSSLASDRMLLIDEYFKQGTFLAKLKSYIRILLFEIQAFQAHPEQKWRYVQRNRIVFQNFALTKGIQLWKLVTLR
jgi:hypothetical protein